MVGAGLDHQGSLKEALRYISWIGLKAMYQRSSDCLLTGEAESPAAATQFLKLGTSASPSLRAKPWRVPGLQVTAEG